MRIITKATNIEIQGTVADYLEKRLIQGLGKMIDPKDNSVLLEVELGRTTNHHKAGDIFRAEVNLNIGGERHRVVSEKSDLNSAIDEVRDLLLKNLERNKDKKITAIKKGGQEIKKIIKGNK